MQLALILSILLTFTKTFIVTYSIDFYEYPLGHDP